MSPESHPRFATASLVEPFTVSDTGDSTRHEGREAVAAWYAQAFEGVPWVGLKLDGVRHEGDAWIADWEYMDGRLEAPFAGNRGVVLLGLEARQYLVGGHVLADLDQALGDPPGHPKGDVGLILLM